LREAFVEFQIEDLKPQRLRRLDFFGRARESRSVLRRGANE